MNINYRPEIDSLRAISIIGVIIYHAKINILSYWLFPGGYYGVDIFFVISGYLITSIIYRELSLTGNFSFIDFYLKRARRILPALLFLLLITIPLALKYLLPTSLIDFSKSTISSLGFSSNLYFYITGLEYGAESGLLKPLLHTWSLAVEEQFYIIFPFLFFLGFRYFKKILFKLIIIISVISFVYAILLSLENPVLNFYILPSRIWELLIGSLVFFFEKEFKIKTSNFVSNLICFLSLIAIFISFMFFFEPLATPNFKTLVPIIGSVMIILFTKKETIISKLFTNKLLIGIGLISYSLYLWHYAIFAFVRNAHLAHGIFDYFIVACFIFLISTISYLFIEKPFRNKSIISTKVFLGSLISTFIIIIFISLLIINKNGFENRFPNEASFSVDNQKYNKEILVKKYELGVPSFREKNKKNILLVGNSHAQDFFYALKMNEDLFPNHEFSILQTPIQCLEDISKKNSICKKRLSKKDKKNYTDAEIVIFSSTYSKKDIFLINKIINQIKNDKKIIILTTKMPSFYFKDKFSLVDRFYLDNKKLPNLKQKILLEKKYFETRNKDDTDEINKKLVKIAKNNTIKIYNKDDLVCKIKDERCLFLTPSNQKIFRDNSHLTVGGAKFIGREIYKKNWLDLN